MDESKFDNLVVSIDEMKTYLRLEGIDTNDDEIAGFIFAATEYANVHNERGKDNLYTKENAPFAVCVAIKMLASHLFENRGSNEGMSKVFENGITLLLTTDRKKFTV